MPFRDDDDVRGLALLPLGGGLCCFVVSTSFKGLRDLVDVRAPVMGCRFSFAVDVAAGAGDEDGAVSVGTSDEEGESWKMTNARAIVRVRIYSTVYNHEYLNLKLEDSEGCRCRMNSTGLAQARPFVVVVAT